MGRNMSIQTAARSARGIFFGIGCGALIALAAGAAAQDAPQRSKNVTLLGVSSATVAPAGLAFVAISGSTQRVGPGTGLDGSMALGFGLGSAEDNVGLQFTSHITSLTDNFGDSGYFELKASRRVIAGDTPTYVGLSVTGGGFGDASIRDTTASVAVTSLRQFQFSPTGPSYPIMFTLGAGTHERNNETDPGVFGGVGIGVNENFGVSASWSGEYLNLGTAFRFENSENFGVSATLFDAFDQEDSRRLGLTFTYFLKDLF